MTNTKIVERCIRAFEGSENKNQLSTAFRYFQLAERSGLIGSEFEYYLRKCVYPANFDRLDAVMGD